MSYSYEPTEREQQTLNQGRLMRAEADVILPLLTQQREAAIQQLIQRFRAGEQNLILTSAAEVSAIDSALTTIRTRIKQAEVIERKVHGHGT